MQASGTRTPAPAGQAAAGAQNAAVSPTALLTQTPSQPGGGNAPRRYSGNPVSLDFQQADLRAVLRVFAEISGLNIVIDPAVKGTVDVALRGLRRAGTLGACAAELDSETRRNSHVTDNPMLGSIVTMRPRSAVTPPRWVHRAGEVSEARRVDGATRPRLEDAALSRTQSLRSPRHSLVANGLAAA